MNEKQMEQLRQVMEKSAERNRALQAAAITIIATAYNEEASLQPLHAAITSLCQAQGYTYEIIIVDDGSTDATPTILANLAAADPHLRPIILQRNFGQTAALAAGIDHARHPLIITMDADLQNDPTDIPHLLQALTPTTDVVSGWRKQRHDHLLTRTIPSFLANILIGRITGVRLHDYGCSLKLYRATILKKIRLYGELHRFIPALCAAVGARVTEIPVRHHPRTTGRSKYGIMRTFRVIVDLITDKFLLSYATRPMHFFGVAAALCLLTGLTTGIITIAMKFGLHPTSMNRNPLFYLTILMGIAGTQFLAVGLVAELVMRTYFESQQKPVYILKEPVD
jgi:glycosyltransferase involved in cell wall biosynthesis